MKSAQRAKASETMRGSGGTEGGAGQFWAGFGLSVLALYFFFDSVNATTDTHGVFSGMLRRGGGGMWDTTSTGLLFVPFFLGVMALFYDASQKWAWVLMWIGLAVIVIEILSRIRFHMNVKTTFLLGVIVMFAAGAGLMLRSYRDFADEEFADGEVADNKSGKPPGRTADPGRRHDPPA